MISVIIPVYNSEKSIGKAIDSVSQVDSFSLTLCSFYGL